MQTRLTFSQQFPSVMRRWWSWRYDESDARWMFWLATVIYNSLFAVVLTILFITFNVRSTFGNTFGETFVISQCIGLSIHGLYEILARFDRQLINHPNGAIRTLVHFVLPMFGALLGYMISFALFGQDFLSIVAKHPRVGAGLLVTAILVCGIFFFISDAQTRAARATANANALRAQTHAAELRALQAQIEPHFLFNTLANVQALIDYEPEKAKAMLDAFVSHLRGSLSSSRATDSTVAQEFDLVKTYLEILRIRLGGRLRVEMDVAKEVADTPLAPLIVQPLVENAVKYGIEPKIEGGRISVRAYRAEDGSTLIEVCDDGVGLEVSQSTARKGTGVGLENVRERLKSTYGATASLTLESLMPGTRARIVLPPSP